MGEKGEKGEGLGKIIFFLMILNNNMDAIIY